MIPILALLAGALYGQSLPLGGIPVVTTSTVATPTDSPGAGTYSNTQTVTLSDGTAGSTICYTTDGSTPGAATPGTCDGAPTQTYSAGFSVSSTATVKAIGTKAAMTNSGVLSSTYTITIARQFMIPSAGYANDAGTRQYVIPGGAYLNGGK